MNELDEMYCPICQKRSMNSGRATAHYLAHIAQMMAEDRTESISRRSLYRVEMGRWPAGTEVSVAPDEEIDGLFGDVEGEMAEDRKPKDAFVSDIALTNRTTDPIYDRNDILLERSAEEARSSTGGMAMRVGPVWMTPWAASYVESKRQPEV